MKSGLKVSDFMTDKNLVVAALHNTFSEVLHFFATYKFQHIPVVKGDLLLGIISVSDLIHVLGIELLKGTIDDTTLNAKYPVYNLMTTLPTTVKPETPLEEAVKLLEQGKFQSLPVTVNNKIVGIITNKDFVRILSKDLNPPHNSYQVETPGFGI
ncbi:MAG: CBS domain-containing protein [Bacteroidetes bacterium]|nr:CBS domain-containing protein [Bacteroidota bacterium]